MHKLNQMQLKHHAAIGGVTLVWTHLENHLQQVLWQIAGLDGTTGRAITQHMSFRALVEAILTVANEVQHFEAIASDLDALLGRTNQLRLKRNEIVHALWGIIVGSDGPMEINSRNEEVTGLVIKAHGNLKTKLVHTTIDDINDIIEEIMEHHNELAEFAKKHLPPVPKK